MSRAEADYLLEALAHQFPRLGLALNDAVSSYAVGTPDPSAELRESALWSAPGYVGVTGGKLTTFAVTARQVLRSAAAQDPRLVLRAAAVQESPDLLSSRYGAAFRVWHDCEAAAADHAAIPGTPYSWAELRWSARRERVVHLDDLLLRRLRPGLLLPLVAQALLIRRRRHLSPGAALGHAPLARRARLTVGW